ncbi:MAG TPA: zf-HC2 domain-containing protein [Gaiellales bacterium]|nr:zf-HC2 domain-containing protein [Gaiellales bacterium]
MRLLRRRHGLACREVVELVTDYLEAALDDRDRERFERHLGGCDGCAAYLEQMRVTLRVAGRIEPEAIDPVFRERLMQAFRGWERER